LQHVITFRTVYLFYGMIFKISYGKKKIRKLGVHQCLVLYLLASFNLQNVFSNQALAHQNGQTVVHLTF